jgi:hypothetical protein
MTQSKQVEVYSPMHDRRAEHSATQELAPAALLIRRTPRYAQATVGLRDAVRLLRGV